MQPTQPTTLAPRVLARDLASVRPGERATLAGWIHRRRVLASVTFLVLRDRTGLAQVVVKDPADDRAARRGSPRRPSSR